MKTRSNLDYGNLARSVVASVIKDFESAGIPRRAFSSLKVHAAEIDPEASRSGAPVVADYKDDVLRVDSGFLGRYVKLRSGPDGGHFRTLLRTFIAHELAHHAFDGMIEKPQDGDFEMRKKYWITHEAVANFVGYYISLNGSYYGSGIRERLPSVLARDTGRLGLDSGRRPFRKKKNAIGSGVAMYLMGCAIGNAAYLGTEDDRESQSRICRELMTGLDLEGSFQLMRRAAAEGGFLDSSVVAYLDAFISSPVREENAGIMRMLRG